MERQKRRQQVHFHLLTLADWLLSRSYKNGAIIFGETPGKIFLDTVHYRP